MTKQLSENIRQYLTDTYLALILVLKYECISDIFSVEKKVILMTNTIDQS